MNFYRTFLMAAFGLLFTTVNAYSDQLFKQFSYDETTEQTKKKAKIHSCDDGYNANLYCIDNVSLFDIKFSAALFYEDGKLKKVTLVKDDVDSSFNKIITALSNTFQLISISSKNGDIDLISSLKEAKSKHDYVSKIASFERAAMTNGYIEYSFIEGNKSDIYKTKSVMDAIINLPESSRTIKLTLDDQAGTALTFELPKRYIIDMRKLKNQDNEKF